MKTRLCISMLAAGVIAAGAAHAEGPIKSLVICADPGNMPLSNNKGEGFENKIAETLGKTIGAGVQYYWRPSIERGLMRTTLSEGNCDVWMDMASDTEGAVLTAPLYRSTFVFAYRSDKNIAAFKTLNEPRLQSLRIGVFQMSAARQALAQHGIMNNTVVQYISHNGDLVPENQPSHQVQQVIDGQLDIAAAWGPMAGYYKTVRKAPLTIQPINTIDDTVPLEFDMALAVPRGQPEIKAAVEGALQKSKNDIRTILDDFGVPLVKCDECVISGDLPSHGVYVPLKAEPPTVATKQDRSAEIARVKKALAEGASPNEELGNAVIADDAARAGYLLEHGASANAHFGDGYTALANATRFNFADLVTLLLQHKADVNLADSSHWVPLMYAAWIDNPDLIQTLLHGGAQIEAGDEDGLSALGVASQNGKTHAAAALVEAGADVNKPAGKGGYTPLMLAVTSGSEEITALLLKHGANVNARNAGGVTPLMVAAAGDAAKIGSLLLQSGADASLRSEDGRTALTVAQSNNSAAMLKLLQENGARGGPKSG